MLFLITASSCAIKKAERTGGIKYATRAQLDNCIRKKPENNPEFTYHTLAEGETVYRLSRIYNTSVAKIIELNQIVDINDIPTGSVLLIENNINSRTFSWPLKGIITSNYGKRKRGFHYGIDIAARKGTPIRSAADGIVILSGNNVDGFGGYGKIIALQHSIDTFSVYAHNNRNYVEVGECVAEGKTIGEVGSTGNATGPHLHFEIRKNETPVNPNFYLN